VTRSTSFYSSPPIGPFNIQVSRVINAPRTRLYDIISDITSMGELSPENQATTWIEPGRTFVGTNRIGALYRWRMPGHVTEDVPGRKFGFTTDFPSESQWVYTFEDAPGDAAGTLVTESVTTNRRQIAPVVAMQLMSGVLDRGAHLRRGMNLTLDNLAYYVNDTSDRSRQNEKRRSGMSHRIRSNSSALDYSGTTVLVTGASSGLGAEFAVQLADRGANLVLVARREDRLVDLAGQLETTYGVSVSVIAADLSAPGAAASLVETLDERNLQVDSLINNAGFGMGGQFADEAPDRLARMVDLNVGLLTDLTRLLLPRLVERSRSGGGPGVLLNVASTAAYQPTPGMAAYGATKAYVLSLTEALAFETRRTPLRVVALSPGPTRTEFFDVLGGDTDGTEAAVGSFQTADQVVSLALQELDHAEPRPSKISGRRNALVATIARLAPRRLTLALSGRISQ
jgi:short-subunit dehydrogenase